MDVLSDVLQTVRLEGALFLNTECHEPWCMNVPRGSDMAQLLNPGARSVTVCHTVLEGRCWIQADGGEQVELRAGDSVALPQGDAHLIGSGLHHSPVHLDYAVQVKAPELKPMRYGGDGAVCMVVCGWFSFDPDVPNPLVQVLPRVFRAAVGQRPAGPWLQHSIRYALAEAASGQPGSTAVATRVAESLFVEMLRAYVDSLPPAQPGWLAGLRDPQVGKCLELMHARPGHDWSVDSLADEIHVSRSVLAQRFNDFVGVPPMQYLKRWRLSTAARLLRNDRVPIIRVTEQVGYESETAFSRAFKKEYGVSPGQWRSGARSPGGAAGAEA